jgi:hypothetical protein
MPLTQMANALAVLSRGLRTRRERPPVREQLGITGERYPRSRHQCCPVTRYENSQSLPQVRDMRQTRSTTPPFDVQDPRRSAPDTSRHNFL